jgi:gluconokinase
MTVLVLDIGSSAARALLFNDRAELIPGASVSQSHAFTTTPPGAATLDPVRLRGDVETCIDAVLQHPATQDIRAVGMATFVGNVLGVDAAGEPVTPIYTYADTRSAEDVERFKYELDPEHIHQRTGCLLHTAYQPGRLAWLKRTEPERYEQVHTWLDVGTYLYRAWFAREAPCSYSVASWSGMLNRADLTWNNPWLRALNLNESALPPLADIGDTMQGLSPAYSERWPALRNVPFCLAVGDGAAANIGCGCVDESRIALTVGTTAALRMVSRDILPPAPPGLWAYRVDAAHHLIGGATSEGGNVFQWVQETMQFEADWSARLANRAPDSHGLTFLPLLAGERSPGWVGDATGALVGLRLSTTPLDILQAALEGVALRLPLIADQLGQPNAPIVGGGGALAASPEWAQMIANALNRPLSIPQEKEITARGVAVLALNAVGAGALNAFPPEMAHTVEPNPNHVAVLRGARQRQAELYNFWVSKISSQGEI